MHLSIGVGSIRNAVKSAKSLASFSQKIEVECRSLEDAIEALRAGADIVMLDNQSPNIAISWANSIKTEYPYAIVEVSGGISEVNVRSYCSSHVDIISMGSLTQDIKHVDFSMKIVKQ